MKKFVCAMLAVLSISVVAASSEKPAEAQIIYSDRCCNVNYSVVCFLPGYAPLGMSCYCAYPGYTFYGFTC